MHHKKDKLFIGTADDGFFVHEQSSGNHRHYNTRNYPSLKDNQIKAAYIDANGEAWIRLNTKGVTHFNPENEQFDHFILQDKYGKDIVDSRPEMYIYEDVTALYGYIRREEDLPGTTVRTTGYARFTIRPCNRAGALTIR